MMILMQVTGLIVGGVAVALGGVALMKRNAKVRRRAAH
jgi:hypothetical protein